MIRHRDVEQLQQLSQAPGQTLTVYLDVDQTNPANRRRQFETRLKDLLKQLKAAHRDDKELAATCSEVEEITKGIKPSGRTLVLARHRKLGVTFRNVIRIAMPSGVYWTNGAFLRPLLEALDEHERFGIVLVDQKRARLFTVFMGEIEEHKDLVSQIPPRPESPSADKLRSQPRMQRRHDESVSAHVKFVAREFGKLMEQLEVDRLIVGGNVGVASELAGALPKRLRGRLVEVLPIPVAATPEDILTRAGGVQTRLERAEELEVVREILKEVRKGGRAVAGLSGDPRGHQRGAGVEARLPPGPEARRGRVQHLQHALRPRRRPLPRLHQEGRAGAAHGGPHGPHGSGTRRPRRDGGRAGRGGVARGRRGRRVDALLTRFRLGAKPGHPERGEASRRIPIGARMLLSSQRLPEEYAAFPISLTSFTRNSRSSLRVRWLTLQARSM